MEHAVETRPTHVAAETQTCQMTTQTQLLVPQVAVSSQEVAVGTVTDAVNSSKGVCGTLPPINVCFIFPYSLGCIYLLPL